MSINLAPLPNGIQLVNTGLTPNDRQGDPLPVAFQKINQNFQLVLTRNEDSFTGPVTFQQTLTVIGPAQFNQTLTVNQSAIFNALARFNNVVEFKQSATFDGASIFNEAAVFNRNVNFVDDVLFQDPVTFEDIVTFTGPVNLTDGVVKPSNLDVINAPTNDLVLGYNAANGKFAWRPQTGGGGGGGGITSVGLAEINAAGAGADRVLRIGPNGQTLVWSDLGGGGGISSVDLGDIQAAAAAPTRVLSITPNGEALVWVDVAEQQAANFQNVSEMILHHGEAIRTAGRNSAMLQNQLVERVFNYTLPLGVAANVEGDVTVELGTSLDIEPPLQLRVVTQVLSQAVSTVLYNFNLVLEGGKAPYNWTVIGDLPPGLSLAPITQNARNLLTGTPTTDGSYIVDLRVTDSNDPQMESVVSFPLEVVAPPPGLAIVTDALPEIIAMEESEFEVVAVNGTGNITWTLSAGSLPQGLALEPTTDRRLVVKGKPTEDGTFTVTFQAVDSDASPATATATLTLTVDEQIVPELEILTTEVTQGMRNSAYEALINFEGGLPPYYVRVTEGSLPNGLSLSHSVSPDSDVSIQGYPVAAGTSTFTIQVRDSSPTPQTVTQEYTIETILEPSNITIVTSAIALPLVSTGYLVQLTAAAGEGTHTWSISAGTLPTGLTLGSSQTGINFIQGKPTTAGAFNFTVRVQDVTGSFSTRTFIGSVVQPRISLTYGSGNWQRGRRAINQAWLGVSYRQEFNFRPVTNPYYPTNPNRFWRITSASIINSQLYHCINSGRLPSGLRIEQRHYQWNNISENGLHLTISGVPLETGVFNFSLRVYRRWQYYDNWYGWQWAYENQYLNFTLISNAAVVIGTPTFVTTTLPSVIIGSSFATQVVIAGGTNVVWQNITGLPTWLSTVPSGTKLRIVGTVPSVISVGTAYSVNVQALVDGALVSNIYPLIVSA